jgi:hypothetical protein
MNTIARYIRHDAWAASDGMLDNNPLIIRFRTPVLDASDMGEYTRRLSVVWPYAPEETGAMPTEADSEAMKVFEDRLIEAWENEAAAVLTAVLTFDGARQWVFYTRDVKECGRLLNEMPQNEDPYPIELTTEEDPQLNFLKDQILGRVSYREHQAQWKREFGSSARG